ncbi:hypothetical protein [Sphingopyxis macrogoltabida]|uniref:Uncharacterized protein n=1 Tax=Sphingopyxis macrogoltabida TaxID=33050 RepID=A0AAC8Z2B9_SPHMC|nr:hypothetical protein [Sphingopyxis macrogoltabida]ALJ14082.1 hypothetical protein LH19_14505 [Sphingopyxis macrogoltabida]AMU90354.1 hypothetical protein ATM17_15110 [Sphingopyxis macrogoltabida]
MKRGEKMARRVLHIMAEAGVAFEIVRNASGERAIKFNDPKAHTEQQRELAVDLVLFAIGYPRNFATMDRLMKEGL